MFGDYALTLEDFFRLLRVDAYANLKWLPSFVAAQYGVAAR